MKYYLLFFSFYLFFACTEKFPDGESQYIDFVSDGISFTIADSAWDFDSLGNHRALVTVGDIIQAGTVDAVQVILPWRRPDMRPETKGIVVIDAQTRQKIRNVSIISFSSEKGIVAFQPQTIPGIYEVYYLPAKFRQRWGDARYGEPWNDYLLPDYNADSNWKIEVKNNFDAIPEAKLIRFEARTRFDFFTPMGLIATEKEVHELKQKSTKDFTLFPEDRSYPIRLTTIPARWIKEGASNKYKGYALPNEFFTWQIGIWANTKSLEDVRIDFSDFKHSSGNMISSEDITCFNMGGTNWDGKPVEFRIDVPHAKVQALWCGLQIPATIHGGKYKGTATISAEGVSPQIVDITIYIGKELLVDKGDGDLWRHSRLRWLNSTIGIDNLPVTPYSNMQLAGTMITATSKTLDIDKNGLPKSIKINGREILNRSMSFVVETDRGNVFFSAENLRIEKKSDGLVQWNASSEQDGLNFRCIAYMEFDGYIRYNVQLSADKIISARNIKLVASYTPVSSEYFMGVGFGGGTRPQNFSWDWKGPWDSYWIGGDKSGLQVEFRGGTYHGPLLNDYKPAPPLIWENSNKGTVSISGAKNQPANVTASTGEQTITRQPLDFEFSILITPVKPVNSAKHFSERYYHANSDNFSNAALEGANIANIHHAQQLNPYINYPYVVREPLIKYIQDQHTANRKVKLYYTIREQSTYTTEIYALKSLNHEIFVTGVGYGVPWLCEHLIDDYKPAWYTPLPDQQSDAALVLNSFSRWINYYLEGLRWMLENYKIDGIYMDDVSFDREVMKRMRKIIAQYRPSALIDLHSNTWYSIGPANQYTDFFPYVDRLWFGESFKYNEMTPDEWFVTFSGIPFGVMSEMLQDGGNRFLGMVYGTTARHSYSQYSPAPVWKLWQDFNIKEAEMLGYWDKDCPVKTSNQNVKATAFVKPDEVLISIGNFDNKDIAIKLNFDWSKININPQKAFLECPEVQNFQQKTTFSLDDFIFISGKKGKLLILKEIK